MVMFEDECVGCPTYCIDCGRKKVPHFYCDECECEFKPEELIRYGFGNEMLCAQCLFEQFERVTLDDAEEDYDF